MHNAEIKQHLVKLINYKFIQDSCIHNICFFLLDEEEEEPFEDIKPLSSKLEDLQTCNDLVGKHGAALQRSIGELQEIEDQQALINKLKAVNEKATLFRITSNAMISVCTTFLFHT